MTKEVKRSKSEDLSDPKRQKVLDKGNNQKEVSAFEEKDDFSEQEMSLSDSDTSSLNSHDEDLSDNEDLRNVVDDDEDELDQLDDAREASSGDDLDESDEAEEAPKKSNYKNSDKDKVSSKEQHAEQRRLLSERKKQRKSGIAVQEIKSLWEKLRVTKPPMAKAARDKLCDRIWELSRDVVLDLVLKHDASRVVQTLVKYSSKERRENIANQLKGSYYQLATSSYGKYLLIKLLHYGSKDIRTLVIGELHGKYRKLMKHREGAYVVEDIYVLYASSHQKKQILREFWGTEYAVFKDSGADKTVLDVIHESSEKKKLVTSNLWATISTSVEKGSTGFQILHAVMYEYTLILIDQFESSDQQIRVLVELLAEQFAELVHTPEGSEVACLLISLANAKERKTILKALKANAKELSQNEYGNLVLTTLFMTIDDTVLLSKTFNTSLLIESTIAETVTNKYSRKPFLYLLKGLDRRYFPPIAQNKFKEYETLAYRKTSKKPQDQRRNELLTKSLPIVYDSLLKISEPSSESNLSLVDVLSENLGAQFLTELVLTKTDLEEVNNTLRPKLMDVVFDKLVKGDVLEDYHLINKVPNVSRSLKYMIQGTEFKWNSESKKLVNSGERSHKIPSVGSDLALKAWQHIKTSNNLQDWCSGQGSFVIVAIFEVLGLISEEAELRKSLIDIKDKLVEDKDNKGAQLILKLLN